MATTFERIQSRGGLEADLLALNPTPLEREIVVATDTAKMWVGDGETPLQLLTAISPNPTAGRIDDGNVSASTTYSSEKIVDLVAEAPGTGGGGGTAVFGATIQRSDGTYPAAAVPVAVYMGSTPPDPSTATYPALFILTGS